MTDADASARFAAVNAYLTELRQVLRHADPDERDQLLDMVNEHIAQAIAQKPDSVTDEDVEDPLHKPGSVDQLAAGVTRVPEVGAIAEERSAADSASPAWPYWVAVGVVVVGVISIPLVLLHPFLALPTAVLAIVAGALGSRAHRHRDKVPYRLGVSFGMVTLVLVTLLAVGMLTVGTDTSPAPAGPPTPATPPSGS